MGDKEGEDLAFEADAFDALEKDFQEVLQELVGDKSLEKFRNEYEKLHQALNKSHEQEKRLIKKCRELNSEIVNNAAKVQTALKLSQEDQNTIASLKKEIEKAWKMVDASHEKEIRAKETIQQLKEEISNLSRLVEQGAGLNVGQENMVKELLKVRDQLTRTNEENEAKAKQDAATIIALHQRMEAMEAAEDDLKNEAQDLKESMANKKAEQEREQRRKERLDKELKELKVKLEKKNTDEVTLQTDVKRKGGQIGQLEKQLNEARSTMEKYLRDYDTLYQRTQKLTEDLDEQMYHNSQLAVENASIENDLKSKLEEIGRVRQEKAIQERKVDKEKKVTKKVEQGLYEEKQKNDMVQSEVHQLQKELGQEIKREEGIRKEMEALDRDRQIQFKNVMRAEEKTKRTVDQVKANERIAKNLETEVLSYKQEAAKQRKLIYQLEKDREKYGIEASEQRALYLQTMEEIKLKEMRTNELQKKVTEGDTKLKQQQQLYEAVRSDRNLYSKQLIESQDEIAEMKRKFKIMNHQIEQLKEEITAKDHALVKEHFDHQKVEKQKEQLKNELARMRKLLEANEHTINNQDAEIRKLTHMIRRMDDEALDQRKEYDQVINERDILGTQLIRRNDELALLYEKLKIQQSTLRKGEAQYQERIQDMRILKLKISDLKRELQIAKHQVGQLDDLKREVYHLQRELLQEKTKVKALSEELENPMNVHRWRKLEGSDPATYEMIQKIQTLQKRLISKTEEVVEKDLLIQEKEKLYVELKNILARQPGPEVAEQLSVYQQNLKDKTRQMKAMASELNMYQAQVNEYRYEIERLTRELQDVKRKYYEQKRRDQMMQEAAARGMGQDMAEPQMTAGAEQAQEQQAAAQASSNRFTGGGFNLQT
jgi:chromosome segregation ATPase